MTAPVKEHPYDPEKQHIRHLLSECEADWGDPHKNREMLLPFGIKPLDLALYGMDTRNGELILIQGPEKQRKSTLVMNIICSYMMSAKPAEKPLTVVDTLESGMTPKRYRDSFISIMAAKVLLDAGHKPNEMCPVCKGVCKQFKVCPDFLVYNERTPEQAAAIRVAVQQMEDWPLMIYGANEKEGDTRSLTSSVTGGVDFPSRWKYLIDYYGAKVFVTDHLQQYSFYESLSDYEKQLRSIAAVSDVVARDKIVALMISQISLTSQREAATGTGKYYASGGKKAAAEATSIISVNYEDAGGEVMITLEDSRKARPFSITQPIEDTSGAFYGTPESGNKLEQGRPGMKEAKSGGVHTSKN